jgi:hypothetical protein
VPTKQKKPMENQRNKTGRISSCPIYSYVSNILVCVGARRKKKKSPFDPIISASPHFIRRMMYMYVERIKRRRKKRKKKWIQENKGERKIFSLNENVIQHVSAGPSPSSQRDLMKPDDQKLTVVP